MCSDNKVKLYYFTLCIAMSYWYMTLVSITVCLRLLFKTISYETFLIHCSFQVIKSALLTFDNVSQPFLFKIYKNICGDTSVFWHYFNSHTTLDFLPKKVIKMDILKCVWNRKVSLCEWFNETKNHVLSWFLCILIDAAFSCYTVPTCQKNNTKTSHYRFA